MYYNQKIYDLADNIYEVQSGGYHRAKEKISVYIRHNGELHERIVWDDGTSTEIDFTPDRDAWLAATQVPLTVIVGLDDTAELPIELIPAQKGRNRFTIARNWVNDMRAFADKNGMESRFNIWIIPGKGHSMMGLLEYSQSVFEKE